MMAVRGKTIKEAINKLELLKGVNHEMYYTNKHCYYVLFEKGMAT